MRRRDFIALGGVSIVWPLLAGAQQRTGTRKFKVGVLWHAGSAEEEHEYLAVLTKAFDELGLAEGKTVEFLHRFPAEEADRFRSQAAELVNSAADVIVAVTTDGALALKGLTSTIPVVFVLVPDPVAMGLVGSLPRPGGNLTGLSLLSNDVSGKRLALLKEAVPQLANVALIYNPNEVTASRVIKANEVSSKALGLSLSAIGIPTAEAIEPTFAQMERDRIDGAVIVGSMMFNERARVGASALAHRLPATCIVAEMLPYGLLMSYGQDFPDYFRKAAVYAAKILQGANPADLPVEQPTRLKQVINLKVANAIGIKLPSTLLVSADEVIE